MCDRYSSRAITERAKLNDIAPKDVKQLEVLKPVNTPSMGERYKQALEKEQRLEAATRPIQKQTESKRKAADEDSDEEEAMPQKKKRANKKKKKQNSASVGKLNEDALDQEDEVEEGIHWSDDEE